jgi:hypothetical protein
VLVDESNHHHPRHPDQLVATIARTTFDTAFPRVRRSLTAGGQASPRSFSARSTGCFSVFNCAAMSLNTNSAGSSLADPLQAFCQ